MKTNFRWRAAAKIALTFAASAGTIATAIAAAKATPKAIELIHADSRVAHDGNPCDYTKQEAVCSCWKCYIPAAVFGAATLACIFSIGAINKKQLAAMTSAYAMLSQSHQKYRKFAKSIYGDDADAKITAEIAKEECVSADGLALYRPDLDRENEKILFYDMYSDRYFRATIPAVLNAEYHLNRNLVLRGDVTANEFYDFLGIDRIDGGDELVWSIEDLMENGIMWLDFENRYTRLDDGMECCIISCMADPVYGEDVPF